MGSLSHTLNTHKTFVSISAIVTIVAMLCMILWSSSGAPHITLPTPTVAFIDTETNAVEMHYPQSIPPMTGKSGRPTVVRAGFFSLDGNPSHKKLYLLERYSFKAQTALRHAWDAESDGETLRVSYQSMIDKGYGLEVRLPDQTDNDWVDANSEAGKKIYAQVKLPDGSRAQRCE